jgi:hypothetical protein
MKEIKKLLLVLFIILGTINSSCQQTTKFPDRLTHSLLYTESKDEEGIGAGDSSEIVTLNLNTNIKYYLTNDRFYDRYPTYSPSFNKIIFESKRFSNPDD